MYHKKQSLLQATTKHLTIFIYLPISVSRLRVRTNKTPNRQCLIPAKPLLEEITGERRKERKENNSIFGKSFFYCIILRAVFILTHSCVTLNASSEKIKNAITKSIVLCNHHHHLITSEQES